MRFLCVSMFKHIHTHIVSLLYRSREDGLTKAVSCPRQQPLNVDPLYRWNRILYLIIYLEVIIIDTWRMPVFEFLLDSK